MANKKITELNEATSVSNNDWLVIVDVANDETKKVHAGEVGGNIPIQDTAPASPEENDLWIDTSESDRLKYYDGTNWNGVSDNITGDTLPIGAIVPFGGWDAPTGWLICDGTLLNKTDYPELFNAIGYSFGGEEGGSTFGLPDLRGRVPVGEKDNDSDFDGIGVTGGEKTHTLTIQETPSHSHTMKDRGRLLYWDASLNNVGIKQGTGADRPVESTWNDETANTGGGQAHNNLQPYQTVNYIIKAKQSAGVVANVSKTYSTSEDDTYACGYINKISNYSTSEIVIGKWIDNKPLYRKTYYISALGNATSVMQPLNINNLEDIVSIKGVASNSQNFFVLPSYRGNDDAIGIQITIDINNGITITTGNNRTGYHAFVTIEYTKSTD